MFALVIASFFQLCDRGQQAGFEPRHDGVEVIVSCFRFLGFVDLRRFVPWCPDVSLDEIDSFAISGLTFAFRWRSGLVSDWCSSFVFVF